MANDKVEKKKKKYSNIIPIKDLMFHCLRNWYWFVISLGITLGAAAYIIKSTPPAVVFNLRHFDKISAGVTREESSI